MKGFKSLIVALAVSILFASCSTYTCPTYTKEVKEQKQEAPA